MNCRPLVASCLITKMIIKIFVRQCSYRVSGKPWEFAKMKVLTCNTGIYDTDNFETWRMQEQIFSFDPWKDDYPVSLLKLISCKTKKKIKEQHRITVGPIIIQHEELERKELCLFKKKKFLLFKSPGSSQLLLNDRTILNLEGVGYLMCMIVDGLPPDPRQ